MELQWNGRMKTMRKGIRLEMWHRTTINEAGLVAHNFFWTCGVAWLPKGLVACFPTGLLPMKSHEPGTSNLYFSYSYPISTQPSKGALNVSYMCPNIQCDKESWKIFRTKRGLIIHQARTTYIHTPMYIHRSSMLVAVRH
jgi:hypothetical protein